MPAKKNPFNKQVEDVAIKFQQHKENWLLANPELGEKDYDAWLAKQKRTSALSWESIRVNKFDGKSTLWELIISDPRVQSEKENMMPVGLFAGGKITEKDDNWWTNCQKIFAPIKAKARSGGSAVGEVTANANKYYAVCSALATLMNGLGLHLLFENAEKLLVACCL